MIERIIRCPICEEGVTFEISEDVIESHRPPIACLFIHQRKVDNHSFIAYLDTELSVCDIEKPIIITNRI